MLFFSLRFYTFFWCFIALFLSTFFLSLFWFHLLRGEAVFLTVDFFIMSHLRLSVRIYSDLVSSSFSTAVCFITFVVFLFSIYYFRSLQKIPYFLWLTFLFLISILTLVNFSDVFFVMLGWDGLGVVSYLLILFYQSPSRVFSATFTLLMNRLGDCLFVLVIIIVFHHHPQTIFFFSSLSGGYTLPFLITLTFITKRALFPFSPWLPAAIAAPTPISSLVHSSTLVTAGLYLIIRNFSYLSSQQEVLNFLLLAGVFTSFYAGVSSLVESDLKKVVALSTLSHLGFICFALGLGWSNLAFFHLLSHAFFKSRLFMAVGGYIVVFNHYQDSRVFSSLSLTNPYCRSILLITEFNLLGLPFLRGFYSKDLVLESTMRSYYSWFIITMVYINVTFTFLYRLRIVYALLSSTKLPAYTLLQSPPAVYVIGLRLLSLVSILFGIWFITVLPSPLFCVPLILKFAPLILVLVCGSILILLLRTPFSRSFIPPYFLDVFSWIFFLPTLWRGCCSKLLLSSSSSFVRSVETGLLSFLIIGVHIWFMRRLSSRLSRLFLGSFKSSILYSSLAVFIFITFIIVF